LQLSNKFQLFTKSLGKNIKELLGKRNDEEYVFRLHHNYVYYMSESQLKASACIARDRLISVGTCFGKYTKSGKFRLSSTCLDYLAQYAVHKVWVKPQAENSFLYGNHILKAGLGRITEDTPQYQGVVVLSMNDLPLVCDLF
jgi:60S ribosome subunit biogenesis protein NIP7